MADHVVVEAKGDNVTRAGVRYDNDYCLVFRLEDGKIKEIREYCDSVLTEKALGRFPEMRTARRGLRLLRGHSGARVSASPAIDISDSSPVPPLRGGRGEEARTVLTPPWS